MRTFFASAVFILSLGLAVTVFGQEPNPGRKAPSPQNNEQQQAPDQGHAQKVSLTGCLAKGTQTNQYVITDQASHQKVAFPGPSQLDQYVNQTVKITGNMVEDGNGRKVFQPDSLNPVSPSC